MDSIEAMLAKVDVVLLESVDGRPHLAQATPVLKAGKRVFIDKPLAASLEDAKRIRAAGARDWHPDLLELPRYGFIPTSRACGTTSRSDG